MKTLDRYISGIFLKNLLVALISMIALFMTQALFMELYAHDYSTEQILIYHLMNVPLIAVQVAPPAVLMATVLTLSGLARTNELVACFTIGFGLRRIISLILLFVFFTCTLILVFEDRILPPTFKIRTNYYWREMRKSPDFFLDFKRDKIWYRSKNMIYNLQRFDTQAQIIHGMTIYTFDDEFNLVQVIGASTAAYTSKGWKLMNGTVTTFKLGEPFPSSRDFKEKQISIAESPKDFQEIEKEVDGLKFKELHRYIESMKNAGADTKSYEVKYHSRISTAFIPIVMCFLAVPFSIGARREGGLARDLSLCLAATFFYWLFYSVGLSLGSNGALQPWAAAWLPSLIFFGLATGLIARKT